MDDKMFTKKKMKIVAALPTAITAITAIFIAFSNYWLIERVHTDISVQTVGLEKIKVDIAIATQKNAEAVTKIDKSRLEQEKYFASMQAEFESKNIAIANKKVNNDQIRLTPDIAKLSNDLRPNLATTCGYNNIDSKTVGIKCEFKNNGAQRASIHTKSIQMYDNNMSCINKGISKVDVGDANTILPGGIASNIYTVILTSTGELVKQQMYRIIFDATTDQQAINLARRLSGGYITESELKELSQQEYIFDLYPATTQPPRQ